MATTTEKHLLLKNGTVLLHDQDDRVSSRKADILITGSIISQIDADITAPPDTEVIDCTDQMISPGFQDTHHHVWQTLLKGRHADQSLLQYLPTGNFTSSFHSAEDTFWGQLAGCLEMIDCGTTSVVDFAHVNYSLEHNEQLLAATAASGIRSVFCYCPTPMAKSWSPFEIEMNSLGGHVLPAFDTLAAHAPWADGRITLGFAFDGFYYLPKEYLDMLMAKLEEYRVQLISVHYCRIPTQSMESRAVALNELGILDNRFLMAHSSNLTQEDADLYRKLGVHVSSTPSTELQMSMGSPVAAFRDDLGAELPQCCSLGVDCQSNNSSFIPGEARIGLQSARATYGEEFLKQGKIPSSVHYTVEDAFNLATIRGARAAKMADKTGSIAVGKAADLAIFSATSPSMLAAAQHDPVAAIILHSSPADIKTVIVDGRIRKRDGKLVDVEVSEAMREYVGKDRLRWLDVAKEVLKRREALQEKVKDLDFEDAERRLMDAWYVDPSNVVDHL